ncbi:hypothetical protein [Paenibacillus elgii]|uniref:hypothetical protein n=1 Tax=Paenibacillus elgii TaxID=189691 RepID=UPI0020406A61|nr:hypothetical protein [Paenibacillus elgii]MCM3270235.1 hypothetical protein [Paenibacillus elgii]
MVRILYQNLQVGTVRGASGVFYGDNQQWRYKHTAKQNQAFGTVTGMQCNVSDLRSLLDDRDRCDTFSTGKRCGP